MILPSLGSRYLRDPQGRSFALIPSCSSAAEANILFGISAVLLRLGIQAIGAHLIPQSTLVACLLHEAFTLVFVQKRPSSIIVSVALVNRVFLLKSRRSRHGDTRWQTLA